MQSWGITIAGTIVQNVLASSLPPSFLSSLPSGGAGIAYAAIPTISSLPDAERTAVRAAFARATRLVWLVMLGFAGAGLTTVWCRCRCQS